MKITRATLLALWIGASPAFAGGVDFAPTPASGGPPYLGVVTDQTGAPLADAKITLFVKKTNSTLVLRADSLGHFFFQGFDISVQPSDVQITCSMEGYSDAQATEAPIVDPTAPIQVTCVLSKTK